MKAMLTISRLVAIALLLCTAVARAADTNPPPQLTIELRDGSRLVGASTEKFFRFHSPLLGDLKLQVKDVRSVECLSTNSTRLVTTSGDTLAVSFADSDISVKTGFGKVNLAVNSIRKLSVFATSSGAYPPGLVGLWSGDNQGKDSAGHDDAELTDITFADGIDGQAFSFNGDSSQIRIPAGPSVDLGAFDGFTVMAWIKPNEVDGIRPLFQWLIARTLDNDALQVWIGLRPDENGVFRATVASSGRNPFLVSENGVLTPGVFQQVALTYDKTSGIGALYVNGVAVARRELGTQLVVATAQRDFWVAPRDDRPGNWSTGRTYSGLMDKIAIYNRALSPTEIQSVCTQENHGETLAQPAASDGWTELMR